MPRYANGLHKDGLGWNYNTGAMAINLACLFGATEINLLGYDFKLDSGGRANWYENDLNEPNQHIYKQNFYRGFVAIKNDLEKEFPRVKIYNCNLESALDLFEKKKLKWL